ERPDLSFILINKSREQLSLCPPEFDLRPGVAERLPLSFGEVDAILVCYALGHFDLPAFVAECGRVLSRGGHVYLYEILCLPFGALSELDYEERSFEDVCDEFEAGGFEYVFGEGADLVPAAIDDLMPSPLTLRGTY